MSREQWVNRDKSRLPQWVRRATGAIGITAALLIPACASSLESDPMQVNTAQSLESPPPASPVAIEQPLIAPIERGVTRDTGMDMDPCWKFTVCGTDLMVPFLLPNGSVGYMTGDTFATKGPYEQDLPPGGDKWRSPVMLRSAEMPALGDPITFDSAAGLAGNGIAPEFIYNSHRRNGSEITVFPNDAVSLPDGSIVVSYQSVGGEITPDNANWSTNYSGLAISTDGNHFERLLSGPHGHAGLGDPVWMNNERGTDESQMWSMQLDGEYVYIISVRAGRTSGPMIALRVPWRQIRDKGAYECWNGNGWGGECKPILPDSKYGEPSLRKLDDGTREGLWVMSYVDYTYTQLMTRTAKSPTGPWSEPKMQMDWHELNALYGGFIHPYSTPDHLILMVSTWQREIDEDKYGEYGKLLRYDVSHLVTSVS